ncbi:MAG: response regulator transcription factor [Mesorhizobium sp.]|nr:MAG: response regulator transcription factor [Mesorhizobium sp.]
MRVLVVEDDKDLNRQISDALVDAGYVVDRAFDGEEGHFLGDTEPYDAVVLDIGLPQMDGISVVARVRALIRRAAGHASSELTCGPLRLDTKASKADVDGVPLKLTSLEFRLLAYLMHHMGEVVSRTELVEHLYDQDFDRDSNTIEVFVGRLRKKMGIDMIETVRGMGYRMREPEA